MQNSFRTSSKLNGGINIYILILFILVISFLLGLIDKKINKILFIINFIILTLMLCFRYGQGTDFFSYNYIFNASDTIQNVIQNKSNVHGEIGFRLLCTLFNGNYEFFIFTISLLQMSMLYKCIVRYKYNPMLSLLLFYPTFYLTYFYSGIRQGIVIALFLGYGIEKLKNKEWKKWIIFCVLSLTIHTSSIVFFAFPFLDYKVSSKTRYLIFIIFFVIGIALTTGILQSLFNKIPIIGYYLQSNSITINYMAVLERIIMLAIILILEKRNKDRIDKFMSYLINIYFIGICIYFLFLGNALLSSRTVVYFKIFEIILLPYLFSMKSKYRQIINILVVSICIVMTVKNVNSYIEQSGYFEKVNVISYPYTSVFNKNEIWNYRYFPTIWKNID